MTAKIVLKKISQLFIWLMLCTHCCIAQDELAEQIRSKLPYTFAFDFMYSQHKSRIEPGDTVLLRFIVPGDSTAKDSSDVEDFVCYATCSLHRMTSLNGREQYFVLTVGYPNLAELYLFRNDTSRPVLLNTFDLPNHGGNCYFEKINGCTVMRIEMQSASEDVYGKHLQIEGVADGRFKRLFHAYRAELRTSEDTTTRVLSNFKFVDLNNDGLIDISQELTVDIMEDNSIDVLREGALEEAKSVKTILAVQKKYLWNKETQTFVESR